MTPYRSPEDLAREHGRIIDGPADANGNGKSRLDGDHGADTANSVRPFDLTNWNPWDRTGGALFPLDVMPGVVGDWIAERAMLTGADVSAFAMAALHIVSGCVDHRVRLQPKQYELDFLIGPALWTMLVGPSSTMKTAVIRSVTNLLRRFDRQDANARDEIVRQRQVRRQRQGREGDAARPAQADHRRHRRGGRARSSPGRTAARLWCATNWPAGSTAWTATATGAPNGRSGSRPRTAAPTSSTASRASAWSMC